MAGQFEKHRRPNEPFESITDLHSRLYCKGKTAWLSKSLSAFAAQDRSETSAEALTSTGGKPELPDHSPLYSGWAPGVDSPLVNCSDRLNVRSGLANLKSNHTS